MFQAKTAIIQIIRIEIAKIIAITLSILWGNQKIVTPLPLRQVIAIMKMKN